MNTGPAATAFTRTPLWLNSAGCALILIDAIKRATDANGGAIPTQLQVVNAVAHSQFTGVTGTYSFDGNGDAVSPPMSLYQMQGGKWVYLRQIDASSK